MFSKLKSEPVITTALVQSDSLGFLHNHVPVLRNNPQADQVQLLLYEIMRVKDLIKYYDSIPNGAGQLSSSILNELVSEAYESLVNYDLTLMKKYYDLLQNCD